MRSALQDEKRCYICGSVIDLERHHILAGVGRRSLSERHGLWVYLCHRHHTGRGGAQYDPDLSRGLKEDAQRAFERDHTRDEWMSIFGKNYL